MSHEQAEGHFPLNSRCEEMLKGSRECLCHEGGKCGVLWGVGGSGKPSCRRCYLSHNPKGKEASAG